MPESKRIFRLGRGALQFRADGHESGRGGFSRRALMIAQSETEEIPANTRGFGLALAQTFKLDAIIIDIGLPGMDRFDVAKRLREDPATADALLIPISGFSIKRFRDLSEYSAFRHFDRACSRRLPHLSTWPSSRAAASTAEPP
jgi:CheY-like chemotaxis protein